MGEEHPLTLRVQYGIGSILVMLKEHFEKGLVLLCSVEAAQRRVLGAQHPETDETRALLTNALSSVKREWYGDVVEFCKKV